MQGLIAELKRRNVFRVATAYMVSSWLIVQVAGLTADAFSAPDWVMRMVIIVLLIGFVPTLVFAWAYELTPEGLKREGSVPAHEAASRATGKRLDMAVIALLLIAIVLLLSDRFLGRTPEPVATRLAVEAGEDWSLDSIAVLPFTDISPQRNQGFLAEGIAETLLHNLAQIQDLRVSARTSSFAYMGRDVDVGTIGRELGVATLLEGSVQRVGDRLRVNAKLVHTGDQSQLWAMRYEGEADDIFAIQDEIAENVVSLLMGNGSAAKTRSVRTDVAVYDLYLEGRQLWQERRPDSVNQAVEVLREAVKLDSSYGPAHAELATALLFQTYYADADLSDQRGEIERHLRIALAGDAEHAQALATRGLLLEDLGLYQEAIDSLEAAMAIAPGDANIQVWLANRHYAYAQFEQAFALYESALKLDPLNAFVRNRYVDSLSHFQPDSPELMRVARETVDLFPDGISAWMALINLYSNQGRYDEAGLAIAEGLERMPDAEALSWRVAGVLNVLGEFELADEWIARALRQGDSGAVWPDFYLHRGQAQAYLDALSGFVDRLDTDAYIRAEMLGLMASGDADAAWQQVFQRLPFIEHQEASQRMTGDHADILMSGLWLARHLGKQEDYQRIEAVLESAMARLVTDGPLADDPALAIGMAMVRGDVETARQWLPALQAGRWVFFETLLRIHPVYMPLAETDEGAEFLMAVEQLRQQQLSRLRDRAPDWFFQPEQLEMAEAN